LQEAIRYGHRYSNEPGSGIKDGSRRVVDLLLHNGATVNTIGGEQSPLHLAIAQNDIELVRLLIARGADVNATNTHGDSALYLARKSKAIEQILRENGAR
jgi:ankyrin repeat protein